MGLFVCCIFVGGGVGGASTAWKLWTVLYTLVQDMILSKYCKWRSAGVTIKEAFTKYTQARVTYWDVRLSQTTLGWLCDNVLFQILLLRFSNDMYTKKINCICLKLY